MALNIPCPHKVDCVESPLANLTSEAPDSEIFIGVYFPPVEPPLNRWFIGEGCGVTCQSNVSQEAANLCAAQLAQICVDEPPPRGDPPPPVCKDPGGCTFEPDFPPPPHEPPVRPPEPPPPTPCNEPQTRCAVCPDGTEFCYTVPACTFFASTVALANAIAASYAAEQAELRTVCMGGVFPGLCAGDAYSTTLQIDGGTAPFTWSIVSGTLPSGLTGAVQTNTRQFVVSGTTASIGNQTIQVRATDSLGNMMQKQFTISVSGILTSSITNGEVDVAYAFQLEASGGVTQGVFSITSGALPDGLTMGAGGLISGTPTTSGDSNFTVMVVFSNGAISCSKDFSMSITDVECIILTESIPAASQNQAYSFQIQAGGGMAPFTFAIIAGSLPAGLSLSAGGLISGTPTGTGISSFTIEATDANMVTCDKDFTLNVFAGACGSLAINATDLAWADSGFSAPSSGSYNFADGANGTFSLVTVGGPDPCDQEGQWVDIKATLCNPGAPIYSLNVKVNFTANLAAPVPCPPFGETKHNGIFLMIERIGGSSASYQAATDFAQDLVLPGGGSTSGEFSLDIPFTSTPQAFQIRLYFIAGWRATVSGSVTITPQTHP